MLFSGITHLLFRPHIEESTTSRGGRESVVAIPSFPTETPKGYSCWACSNVPGYLNIKPLSSSSATSSRVNWIFCSALCQLDKCTESGVLGRGSAALVGKVPEGGIAGPKPVRTPANRDGNNVVSLSPMMWCKAANICKCIGWCSRTLQSGWMLWCLKNVSKSWTKGISCSLEKGGSGEPDWICATNILSIRNERIRWSQLFLREEKWSGVTRSDLLQSGCEKFPPPSTWEKGKSSTCLIGSMDCKVCHW